MLHPYDDEDNVPMNDDIMPEDPYLKYTTYSCKAEEEADLRGEIPFDQKPDNGCWNCQHYNGDFCTLNWNNLDECYVETERDAREPDDYCGEHETDPDAVWEDFHGTDSGCTMDP